MSSCQYHLRVQVRAVPAADADIPESRHCVPHRPLPHPPPPRQDARRPRPRLPRVRLARLRAQLVVAGGAVQAEPAGHGGRLRGRGGLSWGPREAGRRYQRYREQ